MKQMSKTGCAPQGALRLGAGTRIHFDAGTRRHVLIHCDAEVVLNAVAHFVLRLCDGGHTRHGILTRMGVTRDSALARDIQAFLDEARALAWIVERATIRLCGGLARPPAVGRPAGQQASGRQMKADVAPHCDHHYDRS